MTGSELIKDIIDDTLGQPRRSYSSGGWFEYNCPYCAEDNMGEPDGKYNMAVKLVDGEEMYCHCWKCGHGSRLSKIISRFGGKDLLDEYRRVLASIRSIHYYEIRSGKYVIAEEEGAIDRLRLPEGFKAVGDDEASVYALNYLKRRGITLEHAIRFGIGYVGNEGDARYRNMVVIPSYDESGYLNYYTGRDYTGVSNAKMNPKTPKNSIVFNEGRINWYEPVTLVEGPFDHLSVPNSIPMLGKHLEPGDAVWDTVVNKSKNTVNLMLDDDAQEDAVKLYRMLDTTALMWRVRMISCGDGYDPADYYAKYGPKGVLRLLSTAKQLKQSELDITKPL